MNSISELYRVRFRLFAILCAILSVASARAGAQTSADSIPVGARVRVHGVTATTTGDRGYYLDGRVIGGDAGHLVVSRDGAASADTLPFFAMSRVEVNEGHVDRARLVGVATATGAGLGALAYVTVAVFQAADGRDAYKATQQAALVSIPVFAAAGALVGALSTTEKWVAVRIPGAFALPKR